MRKKETNEEKAVAKTILIFYVQHTLAYLLEHFSFLLAECLKGTNEIQIMYKVIIRFGYSQRDRCIRLIKIVHIYIALSFFLITCSWVINPAKIITMEIRNES